MATTSSTGNDFALARIDVKRGDAIDQIKFTYSDTTTWVCGHDGGKADARAVVFTPGEVLTSVTHERFENYKCAGASVEFFTSKGRAFRYRPCALSSGRAEEITTLHARPDHEIISLRIEKGVLKGIEQRPIIAIATANADGVTNTVPANVQQAAEVAALAQDSWRDWHAIATFALKEDAEEECDEQGGVIVTQYRSADRVSELS